MRIISCEQGTEEWFRARLGVPSASNFDRIVTTSGEPSKQREKYLYQLAGELVSGKQEESYQNSAMLRGVELEDTARQLYQIMHDVTVEKTGFCLDNKFNFGCSPDGLIGLNGGLEIKCPNCATHVSYLLKSELPTEYYQQVQGSLLVTELEWWDFMSFYPGIKPLIVRVEPDKKFHKKLRAELEMFCEDLNQVVEKIRGN